MSSAWARAGLIGAWATSALAAAPAPTTLDSDTAGAIVGRVCRDLDGDGQCADAEPGLAGVRVVLETGQEATTDLQGRYHLAALPARAPSALRGIHLSSGRHRLRLDVRTLPPGVAAAHPSVTVELPMSGLALQDFALSDSGTPAAAVRQVPRDHPPTGRLEAAAVPCGAVQSVPQMLGQRPDVVINAGDLRLVGSPMHFAGLEPEYRRPPRLGEQTEAVLREFGVGK